VNLFIKCDFTAEAQRTAEIRRGETTRTTKKGVLDEEHARSSFGVSID
jgi:hypothetical protein